MGLNYLVTLKETPQSSRSLKSKSNAATGHNPEVQKKKKKTHYNMATLKTATAADSRGKL